MRILLALAALAFLVGCTSQQRTEAVPAGPRHVVIHSPLPTPGFHLHVEGDGTFTIDGRDGDLGLLKSAIQTSFSMVDSVSISILLTSEEGAEVPSDIRELISRPGIAVYTLQQIELE